MTHKTQITTAAGLLVIALFLLVLAAPRDSHANVITQGIIGKVATSSLMSVGPQNAVTLFATSSACTSRVITTYANPVMLTFSDYVGQSPNATFGHLQAASTTINYENASYGCGLIKAWGYTASTSITVTGLSQ